MSKMFQKMADKFSKKVKFTPEDVTNVDLIDCGNYYLIPSDLDPEKDKDVIKVVAISDTHSKHSQIKNIPSADILVHGGDFTNTGSLRDVKSYDQWAGDLVKNKHKYKYSVLIAGNHDITLEEEFYKTTGYKRFHHGKMQNYKECINVARNGSNVYLEDKTVELLGVKIYGSPYQPEFCNWAFNMKRGKQLQKEWAKIPDKGIDILITHGPPKYHGDKVVPQFRSANASQWAGCDDLLQRMTEIQDVKFHVFGHIHEGYGVTKNKKIKDTMFINASTVNIHYFCTHKPIMFYVKGRGRQYSDVKSLNEGNVEYEEKKNDFQQSECIVQKDNGNNISIDHSKWMKKRVTELLNEAKIKMINLDNEKDVIEVCEIVKVEGTASYLNVHSKNQWRAGYDIEIECKWKGNVSGKSVEGKVFLGDVTSEDVPEDWTYWATVSKNKEEYNFAEQIVCEHVNREKFLDAVNVFVKEFLQKKPE